MNSINKYLEDDRQWWRVHRIAHAKYQLSVVKNDASRNFWKYILRILTEEVK